MKYDYNLIQMALYNELEVYSIQYKINFLPKQSDFIYYFFNNSLSF